MNSCSHQQCWCRHVHIRHCPHHIHQYLKAKLMLSTPGHGGPPAASYLNTESRHPQCDCRRSDLSQICRDCTLEELRRNQCKRVGPERLDRTVGISLEPLPRHLPQCPLSTEMTLEYVGTHLVCWILATDCKPLQHQTCGKSCCRQCPRHCWNRFPIDHPWWSCLHLSLLQTAWLVHPHSPRPRLKQL